MPKSLWTRLFKQSVLRSSLTAGSLLLATVPSVAATGDVISSFTAPGNASFGLTWDGTNLWLVDDGVNLVYELTTTGTVLSSFTPPGGGNLTGLTWDGTSLWLASQNDILIYELTTTGSLLSSISPPNASPSGLTWDGVNLWNADDGTNLIYEFTTTGIVLSSFAAPGGFPSGLTWDGVSLWNADDGTNTIYELTTTGTVLSSFAAPCAKLTGLTFDGTNFWLACDDTGPTDTIYQLEGPALSISIVKRAFLADGTPVASGATLPKGTLVKYVLYINNSGGLETDVSVQDVLDPLFGYQTGTIKMDNSVVNCAAATCTAAEEVTIFAAVDGQVAGTDGVDGDTVSYTMATRTIDAGNQNQGNAQLDILGGKVWALLLTVKFQ